MEVVDREEIPLDGSQVDLPGVDPWQGIALPQQPRPRTMVLALLAVELGWLALLGGAIYAIWS
ncbi:MAG TPA: hypothetical protein VGI77_08345 [Gaiellaceae bacterium]|jgi:hypothetical protein